MAKAKYEIYTQTELVGLLDKNEDNEYVVILDGTMIPLHKILENNEGSTITMKLTRETD